MLNKEVQQLKANIVENESIMNDTARLTRAANESYMNDTARLTSAANETLDNIPKYSHEISKLEDDVNTCSMDFTIGAPGLQLPGINLTNAGGSDLMSELAGGLNQTNTGSDLMSELAAATQRNRTLKVKIYFIYI